MSFHRTSPRQGPSCVSSDAQYSEKNEIQSSMHYSFSHPQSKLIDPMDQSLGNMCVMRDNNGLAIAVLNLSKNNKGRSSSCAVGANKKAFIKRKNKKLVWCQWTAKCSPRNNRLYCYSLKTSLNLPETTIMTRKPWLRSFVDARKHFVVKHVVTHTHTFSNAHAWCYSQ